jgi:selenocysteine-specific elongation factor
MHVVATAGHVDHGKSTLVRVLTGMEPDRWAEERRRGLTLDLGFAWTALPSGCTVAFVDVPGHERFVATMLAGVGPVPAVLFTVAADEGWMPQSTEHLEALTALGVRHGLLVITRTDLMPPDLALDEARARFRGTPLADIPAVGVSAVTGAGTDAVRAALDDVVARLPAPDPAADVRLWIDRAFTIRGAGTVVTGTLGAGTVHRDDELELRSFHGAHRVRIRGLQCLGEPVAEARGAARVAVNLRGLPRTAVARGDALLTPDAWLAADLVDVRLHPIRSDTPDVPAELTLHIGSAAVPVRVRPLGTDAARLRLSRPLPLRIGDRAVLRNPGRHLVAAGLTVLDVRPPPLRRRGAATRRAAELAGRPVLASAAAELGRRGLARRDELLAMGVPRPEVDTVAAVRAAGWLVDRARADEVVAALATAVAEHDAADPLDSGLPVEAARRAVGLPDAQLVAAVLAHSRASGLVLRAGRLQREDTRTLPAYLRAAMDTLRADLERDPFAAPDADRLAELGLGPRQIASLARAGELLRIANGVVLLPGADRRALEVLAGLGEEFTLSAARHALGTTRRVAVPLLELLARTGRTVRTPDGRHRLA